MKKDLRAIENQLEDTNHDHLGKIITYAAGKEASVIIWIVKRARDEHRQAVEWLNQHTDENIGFFLLEIELWKINGSVPAPRFNIVERPNDWAKAIKLLRDCQIQRRLILNIGKHSRSMHSIKQNLKKYLVKGRRIHRDGIISQ